MLGFDDSEIFDISASIFNNLLYTDLTPQSSILKIATDMQKVGSDSSKYLASTLHSSLSPTTYNDFVSGQVAKGWYSVQAVRIIPQRGLRPSSVTDSFAKYYCFTDTVGPDLEKAQINFTLELTSLTNLEKAEDNKAADELRPKVHKLAAEVATDRFRYYEYRPY